MEGKRRRDSLFFGEPRLDLERAEVRLNRPPLLGFAALAEVSIQRVEMSHAWHRRGETALHGLDSRLGIGLLIAASRHAEKWIEGVVIGQGSVPRMNLALASWKDQGGDGPGIVPPDLLGDAAKELEGRDHAGEDRLGALKRESQNERIVRIGPGGGQDRNNPLAVGELDVDMTEIGLEALAWEMSQRNERLTMATSVFTHVTLYLAIASAVTMFVLQATKNLHGGVALLDRRAFVVGQDLVDDRLKGPQDRGDSIPGPGLGSWFGIRQDMTDSLSREFELARDPPDGFAISTGPANGTVVIHRKHFLGLRAA